LVKVVGRGAGDDDERADKARYVGVSNFTSYNSAVWPLRFGHVPFAASQLGFNLLDRRSAEEIFEACRVAPGGIPMAPGRRPPRRGHQSGDGLRANGLEGPAVVFRQSILASEHRIATSPLSSVSPRRHQRLPEPPANRDRWVLAHPPVTVALVGVRALYEIE
jgi:aryl-alcohol dehydrogenase-like predicted oxidoreductase